MIATFAAIHRQLHAGGIAASGSRLHRGTRRAERKRPARDNRPGRTSDGDGRKALQQRLYRHRRTACEPAARLSLRHGCSASALPGQWTLASSFAMAARC